MNWIDYPNVRNFLIKRCAMTKFNLENRLIDFAVSIVQLVEMLPANKVGNHLGNQLLRSGTSPALNYGEALGGE